MAILGKIITIIESQLPLIFKAPLLYYTPKEGNKYYQLNSKMSLMIRPTMISEILKYEGEVPLRIGKI